MRLGRKRSEGLGKIECSLDPFLAVFRRLSTLDLLAILRGRINIYTTLLLGILMFTSRGKCFGIAINIASNGQHLVVSEIWLVPTSQISLNAVYRKSYVLNIPYLRKWEIFLHRRFIRGPRPRINLRLRWK